MSRTAAVPLEALISASQADEVVRDAGLSTALRFGRDDNSVEAPEAGPSLRSG